MTKDGQRIKNVREISFSGSFKWQEIKKSAAVLEKKKKITSSISNSVEIKVKDIFSHLSDDL